MPKNSGESLSKCPEVVKFKLQCSLRVNGTAYQVLYIPARPHTAAFGSRSEARKMPRYILRALNRFHILTFPAKTEERWQMRTEFQVPKTKQRSDPCCLRHLSRVRLTVAPSQLDAQRRTTASSYKNK